jgi:lipoate-protein ligase B
MGFAQALQLQLATREQVVAGTSPATLLLVEHPPTLTIGRRGSRADVLWTDEQLASRGIEVCETPRGGQVTLHAPNQLVVYPIVFVGRRIREHLITIADVTIALLEHFGVKGGEYRPDHPGVWIGGRKLASIGVHISRGVSVQGLALNLAVDPHLLGALVSCGMRGDHVTSVTTVGGPVIQVVDAAHRWAELYAARCDRTLSWR